MGRSMQLLLLAAAAGTAGAVHAHLWPSRGPSTESLVAAEAERPDRTHARHARDVRQTLLEDERTLEALYCADGPVQLPPAAALNATDLQPLERTLAAPAPIQLWSLPSADSDLEGVKTPSTVGGWKTIIVRMVIVLAFAAVIFGILSVYHEPIQRRFFVKVEHVCCAAYAGLSISIDLSIKNAAKVNGGSYSFNPACAVVAVEALKLFASAVLFGVNTRVNLKEGREIVLPGVMDIAWLMVPGFVYTCNNIIVFQAIGHCPLGAFGVIRETMLIWNAILWTVVFQSPIGRMRWFSILLLFLGCVVNQLPAFFRAEFTWGVLWAFLLAFSNAAGGVANEYAMKRKAAMDINLQNCILYAFCGGFGMIYLLVFQMDDLQAGFFTGFSPQCIQVVILQMLTGLAVSRILKYVDAVTKTIVAALRGPGVIFFGAWIFHTVLHVSEIVATLIVCIACYLYLREGALVKPKQEPAPAKIEK